jgi:gamma-glutamyl-gamma-aminobutyrate hydrolase PuuD
MALQVKTTRGLSIYPDVQREFPEIYGEVYIHGSEPEDQYAHMFVRAACQQARAPEESDLVVFTGGVDVCPALYGEEAHSTTFFLHSQDQDDIEMYKLCLEKGIPMFGVCRGAQFLHVMNGGKLYQDVDNHMGDHMMYDVVKKEVIRTVSSVHHQMCIENKEGGMEVLATSSVASVRWKNPDEVISAQGMPDVEAFFYPATCCLGVQGHPEYKGYNEFMYWTLDQIMQYIVCNPDVELSEDNYRRLKPEVLALRKTPPIPTLPLIPSKKKETT